MFWPGKLAVALQHFSASLPPPAIPAATNESSCSSACDCKCKCCLAPIQKFVDFNGAATGSSGAVQKMVRLSTKDMLLLLRTAQSQENFWSNQCNKVDLLADYEAIGSAFRIGQSNINLTQLEQIMNTITSGYRRELAKLSTSQSEGALRPKEATQSYAGLRCGCTDCATLPWARLDQLQLHQAVHKPSDNWHCSICFRRYFVQHNLLSHLSRRVKGNDVGQLVENVAYKQLLKSQEQQEEQEQLDLQNKSAQPVEKLIVPLSKQNHLDYMEETETPTLSPRKRCSLSACAHCGHNYRYSFSHQLHMQQRHTKLQNSRRWHCDACTRSFQTSRVYLQHLRRVRKASRLRLRKFKCSSCKARFQLEKCLKQHVAETHVRSYRCLICKLPSQSRCCDAHTSEESTAAIRQRNEQLRQEQGRPPRQASKPAKKVVCAQCSKEFRNAFLLNIHTKRIHLKQADFICDQCGKAFYSKKEVLEHIKKVHLRSESVYCEPCGLTIKERGNYNRHCESIRHVEQLTKLAKLQGELPPVAVVEKQVTKVSIHYCECCDRHIKEYGNYRKHCETKKHKQLLAEHQKKKKDIE